MVNGLVRHLVTEGHRVLLSTDLSTTAYLPRLFQGVDVSFWFDELDVVCSKARALGYTVVPLPTDPVSMYRSMGLQPSAMHSLSELTRDAGREQRVVQAVRDATGPSFILTWNLPDDPGAAPRVLDPLLLPEGITVVDATTVFQQDPFDLCGLMEEALQIHAVDGWFLTLADLVGGSSKKFCHAYASQCPPHMCRRKYRKRVVVVARSVDK
jgi:hypothetical protein